MRRSLSKISIVQFFFVDAEEIVCNGNTAFIGPNGSGKSSLLDAIQIVLVGGRQRYMALNAQASERTKRSIRDYCLGVTYADTQGERTRRVRERATSYLALTFDTDDRSAPVTFGVHIHASADSPRAEVRGMFICDGYDLPIGEMLEMVNGERLPLHWETFVASQRARAGELGHHFSTHKTPLDYVREYLHRLQDRKAQIAPEQFLSALKDSLKLNKDAQSIDAYVRHHLIEPDDIDLETCRTQIRHFENLRDFLAKLEAQIVTLGEIDLEFTKAVKADERAACYRAVAVRLESEDAHERLDGLRRERDELTRRLTELGNALGAARIELQAADDERDHVLRELASDPDANRYAMTQGRIRDLKSRAAKLEAEIGAHLSQIAAALVDVPDRLAVSKGPQAKQARRALMTVSSSSPWETLSEAIQLAGAVLTDAYEQAELRSQNLVQLLQESSNKRRALDGRLLNIRRGGTDLQHAGGLIEALARAGIVAEPVCERLRVLDPAWQDAIEAYLGPDRESLIVPRGDEERAIAVLRRARPPAYGVKVIQSQHLPKPPETPALELVASLITSDDDLALRYIQRRLGSMRMVESDAELRQYPFALSRDRSVSSGGGVARRRPAVIHLIGTQRDPEAATRIEREIEQLEHESSTFRLENAALVALRKQCAGVLSASLLQRLQEAVLELCGIREHITREVNTADAATRGTAEHFEALQRAADHRQEEARKRIAEYQTRSAVDRDRFEKIEASVEQLIVQVQTEEERYATAVAQPGYSREQAADFHAEIRRLAGDLTERIRICNTRVDRNIEDARPASTNALLRAREYFRADNNHEAASLPIESWREMHSKVREAREYLQETKLVDYRARTEESQAKAIESFQRDFVMKLGDRVKMMDRHLADINRVLDRCPAFSNGEHYRFEHRVKENLRPLLDSITRATEIDAPNPFELPGIVDTINSLVCSDGSAGTGEIFDYRSFYLFDVAILDLEGKRLGRLSARMGSGSGAEQRIPIFVIAGAALATVYRLDVAHPSDGFGIMLLDEAFDKLDPQNTAAVAQFLSDIGLQLILAAPDGEGIKMTPFCDLQYDITRTSVDTLIIEPLEILETAQELLASDMPRKHPELIDAEVARMAAAATVS